MPPPRRRVFVCFPKPVVAGALALLGSLGLTCSPPTVVQPNRVHVVLISLDGLRPDAVNAANTPTLVQMAKEGAATLAAQTVQPNLTLPAHTSMVTGLVPARHGIEYNDDVSSHGERVMVATIFDVAAQAGLTGAMFVGKSKLAPIVHVGAPQKLNMPPIGTVWKADTVAAHVLSYLTPLNPEPKPDMMFIHLPDIDVVGHASGWMSPQYVAAVRHTDSVVARIWLGLKETFGPDLILIVTADHGGTGTGHSDVTQLNRTTPWIVWGKDVKAQILTGDVRAVDVGPTMLWLLGLTPPADWDGVPIKRAFPTLIP